MSLLRNPIYKLKLIINTFNEKLINNNNNQLTKQLKIKESKTINKTKRLNKSD